MKISPARRAAFDILYRVDTDRAFSSVLLPAFEEDLSPADRALCHELVLGILRRQLYLDRLIDHQAGQKKLDVAVRIALRLGIYQLLFLDRVPAYSAINESVNLVQMAKKTSARGFVNAVLRRISEKIPVLEFADEIERISIETSHPKWLLEKWMAEFGFAEAEQLAAANNQIPRIAFRYTGERPSGISRYQESEFVEGCYIAPTIDVELHRLADVGEIYFQDEASQLVAQVASRDPRGSFLDLCAAPGGKTTQVAAEYFRSDPTTSVVAGDLRDQRVDLLRATCERQGLGSVAIVQYDAESGLPFPDESFDTVLVDAPCSGTGTIRHNPEIRYFLGPADFAELSGKQLRILNNASKLVSPGGRLIYSTCSLEREENEIVCGEFLTASTGFTLTSPDVPERFVTGEGFARTFPQRDGTDGFFIAELRRRR
jgi:16S rRNA (cytosine967-C5)-methyltransferase